MSGREVFFESKRVGNQVRLCAVDALTGIEAVVMGPATASRAELEKLAVRKLEYVMAKKAQS